MSVISTAPENARLQDHARHSGGLVHLVLAGVLWGTGGLTGRLLGQSAGLSALAIATYRLTVGGALIVGFLLVSGAGRGRGRGLARVRGRERSATHVSTFPTGRRAWTRIVQIGLLAALFQACYFEAVSLTSVSLATLITIGAAPVLVLAFEQATGRRRITRRNVAAVWLALGGLILLIGWPSGAFTTTATIASAGLAILSATGFAAVSVISTNPVPGLDDLTVTGYGFTLGGLLLAALTQATSTTAFHPDPKSMALVLALGVGPTAVAYTCYFRGLRRTAASTATVIALLEPLTSAVLAAVFLGDRLGATGLAGASLLLLAVLLAASTPG